MSTAELLTAFETCPRKGFYGRSWALQRLSPSRMVSEALRVALTAPNDPGKPFGETAGDAMMQLGEDRGLDTDIHNIYDVVVHHACLADILVSAIRKPADPPWLLPEPVQNWRSGCYLSPDGSHLRRVVLVTHWTDEREVSESRSWFSIGEIIHYELPMQLVVLVIGQQRNGKRHSPWAAGFLHPQNHTLRFRKKGRSVSEVFNDKWERINREDHAEISRETWLNGMLKDDVLPEVCFRVDVPVPEKQRRNKILGLVKRQMDRLESIKRTPDPNLSTCYWPVPCQFRKCCHVLPEREPSEQNGFIQIQPLGDAQESPQSSPISA